MSEAQNGGNVMERLTDKAWRNFDPWECCGQDKYCQRGCHDPGGCTKGCIVPQLYARVGAYEDTALTPEEVLPKDKADEIALKLMRLADLESLCNYTRLRELAEADKAGRVLILPCKVGDTLYRVNKGAKEPVIMMRVIQLYIKQIHKDRTVMRIDAINDADMGESCYLPCDIGERIFLTREEAEAKLKEMEEKDGR